MNVLITYVIKQVFFFLLFLISFYGYYENDTVILGDNAPAIGSSVSNLPHPDHIIFVWFENKNYNSIVTSNDAPYLNSLMARGTLFTNMSAITHPSYPNYVAFFAGDPNGVVNDNCINSTTLTTPNLFTSLKSVKKSFAWYSEGLPKTGSTVCEAGLYAEKHNPTTIFQNVPDSANKRFADFPTDFTRLENVVCISPDLNNDMHDGSIAEGDAWLKRNLSSLIDWCTTHNSIFVVYFDENDGANGNKIPVVAIGSHVRENFQESIKYDHYSWTRTICSMFGANPSWTTKLRSKDIIKNCWK